MLFMHLSKQLEHYLNQHSYFKFYFDKKKCIQICQGKILDVWQCQKHISNLFLMWGNTWLIMYSHSRWAKNVHVCKHNNYTLYKRQCLYLKSWNVETCFIANCVCTKIENIPYCNIIIIMRGTFCLCEVSKFNTCIGNHYVKN